jgi:putative endonuclease
MGYNRCKGPVMTWFVYILECKGGTLYTGITSDLERRFREHLGGKARYTSYNPPKRIVYSEVVKTKSQALKREAEIKKYKREKKLVLITSGKVSSKHVLRGCSGKREKSNDG